MMSKKSKKYLFWMYFFLFLAIACSAMVQVAPAFIFDGLSEHNRDKIILGFTMFAGLQLTLRVLERLQQHLREWVIGLNWHKLDDRVTDLFLSKSVAQHVNENNRLAPSSINKGRWQAIGLQAIILFDASRTILEICLSAIALYFISVVSGGIMTLLITIYILWSVYMNYKVTCVCTPIEQEWRRLNKRREERWEKVERVKANDNEKLEIEEMSNTFFDINTRERTFWLWYIDIMSWRGVLNLVCLLGSFAWGVWLVWTKKWEGVGLLYPLFSWSSRVSENVWKLGQIEQQINWSLPAIESMIKALDIKPAIIDFPDAIDLDPNIPHRIEFMNVSHTFKTDEKTSAETQPALVRVNFTIEPGEKVACLGPSGAGKSTTMRKLMRFDDPTSGDILVDGISLRKITQSSWRRKIGYIPQQSQVFDGTIRDNLIYGLDPQERKMITDEKIWEVMRLLKIDFKGRLTQGLNTRVGKNGLKLSGGEAQRLMIGAAVMKDPWLLVIDEATASLDSTTEKLVQAGLEQALSGNTSALIVAHRLSTVRHLCTKFVVLKPATEVGEGESQIEAIAPSFEALYEISPTFRQLADDQGISIGNQERIAV